MSARFNKRDQRCYGLNQVWLTGQFDSFFAQKNFQPDWSCFSAVLLESLDYEIYQRLQIAFLKLLNWRANQTFVRLLKDPGCLIIVVWSQWLFEDGHKRSFDRHHWSSTSTAHFTIWINQWHIKNEPVNSLKIFRTCCFKIFPCDISFRFFFLGNRIV